MKSDYQTIAFKDSATWRTWLSEHCADIDGIWMRIYKKNSGVQSIAYAEALDQALCFGWIDGQKLKYDELSFLQKFTPRRKRSLWSKRNIEYIDRLTKAGLMMPSGMAEVEAAKADGRWQAAYDKPSEMVIPADFLAELDKRPKAKQLFETLKKSNLYAIAWRLQAAKTEETRQRRMEKILDMLERGETFH